MATFYSSFFSSGLLAPQPHTPQPSSPSTPRQTYLNFDHEITPTALPGTNAPGPEPTLLPSISLTESAPTHDHGRRLRRRRSSLTASTSPLATIKSTTAHRTAAASVQRQSLIAGRSRSGSDASTFSMHSRGESVVEEMSVIRRLRSGSVGTALRPRRTLRRNAPPAPPPPTAPLPALPLPQSHLQAPTTPRRPLQRRVHTMDNASPVPYSSTLAVVPSSPCDSDYALPSSPGYPALGNASAASDLGMRKMQLDYPSPIEGEGCLWDQNAIKEN
ncbi:hypothetical protein BKA93DRAFT_449211 [Sparassis latifolia]|uniref:Uncharacterized protein n=1 Tax=Sparassis crispa TaxID=139825 RepID=A0A401H4L7_9APHY|nr:predicted protein [Sparassis crispa]GBE89385.1 predicted protein [Sparassis crispa]